MIEKILSGILGFVISGITLILSPLDTFITNNLPSMSEALTAINNVIDFIIGSIGYVIDASGLTPVALSLIVAYYTFSISATLSASVAKQFIKWYKAIVP